MTGLAAELRLRARQLLPWWTLALAASYATLIPVLIRLEAVPGVTALLGTAAAVCFLAWSARQQDPSQLRLPTPLARGSDALRGLPSVILWLPLPISLSWVAAAMARVEPSRADYYPAFGLWVAALILFLALFLAPLAVENRKKLWALVPAIAWPEVAAVAFITAVAFAVRFIDLADEPGPPLNFNEAFNSLRGSAVEQGVRDNLFEMGGTPGPDQPNLYYATIGLSFKLFGTNLLAARLPTAILGAVTVPLLYLFLRELFDRRVAFVGAAFLAVLHFPVHYSRLAGYPNSYDAFFGVLVLYLAFRFVRTGAFLDFALAGLASGLIAYFYSGARLVLLVLIILLAYTVLRTRGAFLFRNFWGLTVLLTGFIVAVLPAALFFQDNPENLSTRWDDLNIFDTGWLDSEIEATGHSQLHVIWDRFQQSLGALVIYPDEIRHYNAGTPLLDGVSAVFFVIGGVYALFRILQPRFLTLFALLLLAVVLGGALIRPPTGSQRLLATAPVAAAFVAVGVVLVAEAAARVLPRIRWLGAAVAGSVLLLIAFVNLDFYFGDYLPSDSFGNRDERTAALYVGHLDSFDDSYVVYIFRGRGLKARDDVLRFLARDKILVDVWAEGRSETYLYGWVVDEEKAVAAKSKTGNALALFALDRIPELVDLRARCPGIARGVQNDKGTTALVSYQLPDGQACLTRAFSIGG